MKYFSNGIFTESSVVDPDCGSGSRFFTSMQMRIRIQGAKPMQIRADPDNIGHNSGLFLTFDQFPCSWIRSRRAKSMRIRIHNTVKY
jgi:hypothetical protein